MPSAFSADEELHRRGFSRRDGEQGGKRYQRDRRQVLEQQHAERHAAVAQGQLALLLEHLKGERGGRQGEGKTGEQGRGPSKAEGPGQ